MLVYIAIIVAGVVLDQLSKIIVVNSLSEVATLPIIPNVLHLTYIENTGAAFSILSNSQIFLVIITIIFIGLIGYLFFLLPKTKPFFLANLGFSLIISGAIGNLLDRIRLSYVVDFIDLRFINFAIFNLADTFIVVGAGILILAYLKNKQIINIDLKPIRHRRLETDEEVEENKPIHKNVIKDLLPHRSRDITPDVKTSLIKLPDHGPETEYVTVTESYEAPDYSNLNFHEPVSLEREHQLYEERIKIHNENRYSKQMDHYEELIKGQLEETRTGEELKTRYNKSLDNYEASIKNQKPVTRLKKENVWQPMQNKVEVKQKHYEFDWNPEVSKQPIIKKKSYDEQIANYQNSIQKQKESQEGSQMWRSVSSEIDDVEVNKTPRNRYDKSTDHYIESIKEASKKSYTSAE